MARTSLLWITEDLLHCPRWKLPKCWRWGKHKAFSCFHLIRFFCDLTNTLNRLMALHHQQLAKAGSQSDILHQQTVLSSAMMHPPWLMLLPAKNTRWPAPKERPRKLKVLPVIFWPSHQHQMPMPQQMLPHLHQKVIDNFQPFFLIVMHTLAIISFGIPKHSRQRYRRGGRPRDCLSNISDSSGISFVHSSPSDIYLIFVFLRQIQRLPSKRARTTASSV